ncbi:MAG: Flp pilus assembly protein CpaB [Bacillota bacterium]
MKGKINLILIIALVFGLAAAGGTYQYFKYLENTYKASGNFYPVAVAKTTIPARQVITEQMVDFTEMPSNYINQSALGKPGDVIGKMAKETIYPGEQIIKNKLADSGDPTEGLSLIVEPGRRAMTIAVNEVTGVAGLLKPGDRVDILGTVNVGGKDGVVTSLLIQNIKILAVNKSTSVALDNKQTQTGTLTLSVSPVEAQHLTMASEQGSIRVLLRSPSDSAWVEASSTRVNNLVR